MKLEDFNALSDEEKATYLNTIDAANKQIEDLTAERDSFKSENEQLRTTADNTAKELKATKELNFTLARKVSVDKVDDETALYNFIKGVN